MTHSANNTVNRRGDKRRPAAWAALAALAILGFSACFQTEPGGGTENSDGIRLTGRVVGTDLNPVAGVAVTLASSGLTDTTDALGRYVLTSDSSAGDDDAFVLDTLRYFKNGQSLARVSVLQWVDSLPDVQLIQRDISGLLNALDQTVTRVEAILTGDGIDSTDPVVTEFYHNTISGNYSGFLYFAPTAYTAHYQVTIRVYGTANNLIGQSLTVPFNSFAGNITVPEFSAANAYPVVHAGNNSTVSVGSAVALSGTAADAFGGSIVKYEWKIGSGSFVQTATGDTTITAPSVRTSSLVCVLRATDNEGNASEKSVTFKVGNDNPVIVGAADTIVGPNASVTLQVAASDSQGIKHYLWDFDGDGINDDTTITGTTTHMFGGSAKANSVIVTVHDLFDGVSRDTSLVHQFTTGLQWTSRTSGSTERLAAVASTGSQLVASGYNGTLLTSPDGATWTARTTRSTRPIQGLASSGNQIVAIPGGPTTTDTSLLVSTDGINWTGYAGAIAASTVRNLIWANGRYVGVSTPGGAPISSADGITWTRQQISGSQDLASLIWTGARFVYFGGQNQTYSTSLDGITWTTVNTSPLTGATGRAHLVWTGSQVVLLWGNKRFTSPDGLTWTAAGTPQGLVANQLLSIVWHDGQLVGVGIDGLIAMSADQGLNWATRTVTTEDLLQVIRAGNQYVAVGHAGTIFTSP